ncbi:hypothetical protein C1645_830056 [Glomus cerebriforme]|uniref:Uncharacterized protein n=1 Tax=Glomus cerebriforme TaxID=658196 RepID=A0A397SIE8_9GLOM|nr:hypothetical protein C1645_830056 [Glomus cerebriforme]
MDISELNIQKSFITFMMTSHKECTEPENISRQVQQDDTNKEQVEMIQLNNTIP